MDLPVATKLSSCMELYYSAFQLEKEENQRNQIPPRPYNGIHESKIHLECFRCQGEDPVWGFWCWHCDREAQWDLKKNLSNMARQVCKRLQARRARRRAYLYRRLKWGPSHQGVKGIPYTAGCHVIKRDPQRRVVLGTRYVWRWMTWLPRLPVNGCFTKVRTSRRTGGGWIVEYGPTRSRPNCPVPGSMAVAAEEWIRYGNRHQRASICQEEAPGTQQPSAGN